MDVRTDKVDSDTGCRRSRARLRLVLVVGGALLLSACARGQEFVTAYAESEPTPANFTICYGYGCMTKAKVQISPAGWSKVKAVFKSTPRTPAEERATVAKAIALLEQKVGSATGTDVDEPGADLFAKNKFQQDCIDETVNTTTYLKLLKRDNLIRFHKIGEAAWRGQFIDRWPHNTAVLVENKTGASWAIDSWFFANGAEPVVVPLKKWKAGWSPPEPTA